jgi:hypothetical protein
MYKFTFLIYTAENGGTLKFQTRAPNAEQARKDLYSACLHAENTRKESKHTAETAKISSRHKVKAK